ncbi:hypothetical protein WJX73_001265 [Symbiochloris irregularis]|uniref:C2H2-type domain-containing protein n=1 Tax=Symbiochloris irregularis TaxID=706552 RepID=A0AAW1NYC8_9CHLO
MSGRGINASLAVQVESLKKSMQKRDTRRTNDRLQRQVERNADPYEHFCHLCQVSFASESQMRQHIEGPTHRKALAKAAAQREREERLGASASAASEAVAAAAWAEGGKLPTRGTAWHAPPLQGGRGSGPAARQHNQGGAARGSGPQAGAPGSGSVTTPAAVSHAQLVANARKTTEPLTINGWMPPSLGTAASSPSARKTHALLPRQLQPSKPAAEPQAAQPQARQAQMQQL